MADDRDDSQSPADPDRAAILARRQRFIAIALSSLASTAACKPQPCLNVSADEGKPDDGKTDGKTDGGGAPTPCLKIAQPDDAGTPPPDTAGPRPCLDVSPPSDPATPRPCLEVAPPPDDNKAPPQPCLKIAQPKQDPAPPRPCLKVKAD